MNRKLFTNSSKFGNFLTFDKLGITDKRFGSEDVNFDEGVIKETILQKKFDHLDLGKLGHEGSLKAKNMKVKKFTK